MVTNGKHLTHLLKSVIQNQSTDITIFVIFKAHVSFYTHNIRKIGCFKETTNTFLVKKNVLFLVAEYKKYQILAFLKNK